MDSESPLDVNYGLLEVPLFNLGHLPCTVQSFGVGIFVSAWRVEKYPILFFAIPTALQRNEGIDESNNEVVSSLLVRRLDHRSTPLSGPCVILCPHCITFLTDPGSRARIRSRTPSQSAGSSFITKLKVKLKQ